MIPELFLTCALALPVSMSRMPERHYDVTIFRFMVNQYRNDHFYGGKPCGGAYLIGGDEDILLMLRQTNVVSWRMTIEPSTPYDVVAFPNAIPFARESAIVVLYFLKITKDIWGAMRLWSETTRPLAPGGIIAFYRAMDPFFRDLAKAQGYDEIPFRWYDMELWRKPPYHNYSKNIPRIAAAA